MIHSLPIFLILQVNKISNIVSKNVKSIFRNKRPYEYHGITNAQRTLDTVIVEMSAHLIAEYDNKNDTSKTIVFPYFEYSIILSP